MDEVEKRLRQDAERIDATVTPELEARVQASLRGATRAGRRSRETLPLGLWVVASLSGAAAAALVILLLPRARPPAPVTEPLAQSAPLPERLAPAFPLTVETADLTAPLEQELENLQSDIEKARERVKEDLDWGQSEGQSP